MAMTDQLKLLQELAKKIKQNENTKEQSLETLIAAKILTKNGRLTVHYPNLGKLILKYS